jgi:predicted glycoside hydrolase/deacetylase ChbG (UPF0249 family)
MVKEILFTADDLGLDEQTNLTIENAHRHGVLSAASLMLGQPGTAHAVQVARRNPALEIGWHFHFCDSQPLTRVRWPWGRSPTLAGLAIDLWPGARRLLQREVMAQWLAYLDTGLPCHFLNGHHHLHIHPFIARELHRVTHSQFNGWVRGFEANFFDANESWLNRWMRRRSARWLSAWPRERLTGSLWGLDRTFCMNADEIVRALSALPDGRHEFMFHPRRPGDADHRALIELKAKLAMEGPGRR